MTKIDTANENYARLFETLVELMAYLPEEADHLLAEFLEMVLKCAKEEN